VKQWAVRPVEGEGDMIMTTYYKLLSDRHETAVLIPSNKYNKIA